jgi:hypothetical protein
LQQLIPCLPAGRGATMAVVSAEVMMSLSSALFGVR